MLNYNKNKLYKLMDSIEYKFKDESLLIHALTHPSYSNENFMPKEASNQRLEFLGDAVLELISSEFLFFKEPVMQEGKMTKLRAALVCEESLAESARAISLSEYIILGKGEKKEGINFRDSVLSDTFESIIGAIYLDSGLQEAKNFVINFVMVNIKRAHLYHDAKTMLQEYASKRSYDLSYKLIDESGPCHERHYKVSVYVDNKLSGTGEGTSKKKAEQDAAYKAIKILDLGDEKCI